MVKNETYEQWVKSLQERTEVVDRKGSEVIIKKLPDTDAVGELDPRVYEINAEAAKAMAGAEFPDPSQMDMVSFALKMREFMGWKNFDVTTTDIRTEARMIPGTDIEIPVRIYTPAAAAGRQVPAMIFFHGGGFMGGTLDVVENPCKVIAERAETVVVSVDYRLAPEHAYPAGLTDCFDVVKWVYANAESIGVNREQIAVSGDSAGGNLATVCAMKDRDQGTNMIKYQALIYPTTNMAGTTTDDFEWTIDQYTINNHQELIVGGIMGMGGSTKMLEHVYVQGNEHVEHPYLSPLLAEDLSGMPETLVISAEFDYLRLENEAYARKLERAGVKTSCMQYSGMDHAFMDKMGQYPQAEDCMNEIAKGMKRVFAS
ncbi:alpha/beta hydrolase [Paenibacillus sp. GCM10027629]|uniref:alpha/beta hydrolase n=1 Tax=Paenibacillus sp. GCM10027629 TaxID=3273414 RepID=UPI00362B0864